eukprot:m.138294 g.138294  ORF g.138294 m.138294 type:complete len:329 (+) comp13994_c0_seq1:143-1129(+)
MKVVNTTSVLCEIELITRWPEFFGFEDDDLSPPPALEDASLGDFFGKHIYLSLFVAVFLSFLQVLFYNLLSFFGWRKRGRDRVALELVCFVAVSYLAVIGIEGYYFRPHPEDPIFGFDRVACHAGKIMLGYQLWNFLAMFFVENMASWQLAIHHSITASVAHIGIFWFMHGFASYFFGVIESTNVILVWIDIFKNSGLDKKLPTVYNVVRFVFAISFFVFRTILWIKPCYLALDSLFSVFSDPIRGSQAHIIAATFGIFGTIVITSLQVIWGVIIYKNFFKFIFSSSSPSSPKAKTQDSKPSKAKVSPHTSQAKRNGKKKASNKLKAQ